MTNKTIQNANNTPINVRTGTIPNVGGGMLDWFQLITFGKLTKQIIDFQVVEVVDTFKFRGVLQPFSSTRLYLKPEGQRAWQWLLLHTDPETELEVDDIVFYRNLQTRVMSKKDYSIYGYVEYELIQDWTGSGPTPNGNFLSTENDDRLATESGDLIVTN